jgi:hypothetical protein
MLRCQVAMVWDLPVQEHTEYIECSYKIIERVCHKRMITGNVDGGNSSWTGQGSRSWTARAPCPLVRPVSPHLFYLGQAAGSLQLR